MAQTVDLRGKRRSSRPPRAVLADPSGRRALVLRQVGRIVGVLFVLWLIGLLLGLGILPGIDGHTHHKNTASKHGARSGTSARPETVASEPLVPVTPGPANRNSRSAGATRQTGAKRSQQAPAAGRGKSVTTTVKHTARRGKALGRTKIHVNPPASPLTGLLHQPNAGGKPNLTAKDGNGPLG